MSKRTKSPRLCHPPRWLQEGERLASNGHWYPVTSRTPALAFSGRHPQGYPVAVYPTRRLSDDVLDGPCDKASERTCNRFGCSNGQEVRAVASRKRT